MSMDQGLNSLHVYIKDSDSGTVKSIKMHGGQNGAGE